MNIAWFMYIRTASQRTNCTHLLGCNSSIAIGGGSDSHQHIYRQNLCTCSSH